jgi:hypothetical protein
MSSRGGAPDEASSGAGNGTDEKCVMDEGQTLLISMSMSCDGAAADRIAARELNLSFFVDDFVNVFESSLSTVCEEKYGEVKP